MTGISDSLVAQALSDSARVVAAGRSHRADRSGPVRIEIVASQLARLGLEGVFAKARHCQVVKTRAPDIVVLDTGTSAESVVTVRERFAEVPVVVIAPSAEASLLVDALHAGARGVLVSQLDPGRLIEAVEIVAANGVYICPAAGAAIVEWFRAGRPPADPLNRLSEQEQRIVRLIADGLTNRIIAATLGLSEHTVKTYVSSALRKLGFKNRSQVAAVIARRQA